MRIVVGSDHRGYEIRSKVIELCKQLGHEVEDVGAFCSGAVDYPDVAADVATRVGSGDVDRGILVCGTGLGMSIAANKVRGVRAAPCHDQLTVEVSRRCNDANVLCLSADLLGEQHMGHMIELWLNTPFDRDQHAGQIEKIRDLESRVTQEGSSPQ